MGGCVSKLNKVSWAPQWLQNCKPNESNKTPDGFQVQDMSPRPPMKTKKQIVPDISVFKDIDEHALKASDELRLNIQDLVNYLIKPTRSDLEKVRAFYRWIAHNIRYDTEGFFSGTDGDCSPTGVLSSGISVCEGYANLFQEFCKLADVPVKKIPGFSKGFGWKPGTVLTTNNRTDHAWNAVFIAGDWRFVECTWGAGNLDKQGEFCQSFNEFYFFTNPADFIVDHFPLFSNDTALSNTWQLLDTLVPLDEFCLKLRLKPLALELGLKPLTHFNDVIDTGHKETVRFSYPEKNFNSFMNNLWEENGNVMKNVGEHVMLEGAEDGMLGSHLLLPHRGTFVLELYGRAAGHESNKHDMLLSYAIHCNQDPEVKAKYPYQEKMWGPDPDYHKYGFTKQVTEKVVYVANDNEITIPFETNKEVDVQVSIQHAEHELKAPKEYCFVNKIDKSFMVTVRLPFEGYYKLSIKAKRPWSDDGLYWEVITYLIECKSSKTCPPFPVQYSATSILPIQLLEPMEGELPANTKTRVRIRAPTLHQVMVMSTTLDKKGDVFEGEVITPEVGEKFTIFGSAEKSGGLDGLFKYIII